MKKKGIDSNIDTMLLHTMSLAECPDMILYEDVYFTKNAFAKQVCHTLAADPVLQGKGIGKQMVWFCIQYAKEKGYLL